MLSRGDRVAAWVLTPPAVAALVFSDSTLYLEVRDIHARAGERFLWPKRLAESEFGFDEQKKDPGVENKVQWDLRQSGDRGSSLTMAMPHLALHPSAEGGAVHTLDA